MLRGEAPSRRRRRSQLVTDRSNQAADLGFGYADINLSPVFIEIFLTQVGLGDDPESGDALGSTSGPSCR
jgi:hypothetical protein